jgi:diamine N-acetyltransferase
LQKKEDAMTQKQQFENHRELSEKRIVVLGGSSGIGLAVAQQVVARGARAIIASSNADRVKQAVATLDGKAKGHGLSAGAHCKEVDLEFAITRCRIGDETRLSLLGKATFLETYADSTEAADLLSFVETEHSVARYRSWLRSDFSKIWIAETVPGRSAIGYALALALPNVGFALEIEIKRLYVLHHVLHRFHRSGLGRRLLNEIVATARQDGVVEVFLKVQKINQNAVDFYSRNGFRVVGEESFRVGARDHAALVMRLALGAPTEGAPKPSATAIECRRQRLTNSRIRYQQPIAATCMASA